MTSSKDEYQLFYYPATAGRAEFVRIIFEEAGMPYRQVNDMETMMKIRNGTMEGIFPAFAPPMIRKGDFTLAQTPVICRYLGKQFGLFPDSEEDQWHADQINATVHDFMAEGCLVFHGKSFIGTYESQKVETQPYIDWFNEERMEKWLTQLERCLQHNNGGNGFMVGNKLTYVDLGVLHVLRAAASQFANKFNALTSIPLLKAFKARLEARPNLAAYFKSDRCIPFVGDSMM